MLTVSLLCSQVSEVYRAALWFQWQQGWAWLFAFLHYATGDLKQSLSSGQGLIKNRASNPWSQQVQSSHYHIKQFLSISPHWRFTILAVLVSTSVIYVLSLFTFNNFIESNYFFRLDSFFSLYSKDLSQCFWAVCKYFRVVLCRGTKNKKILWILNRPGSICGNKTANASGQRVFIKT